MNVVFTKKRVLPPPRARDSWPQTTKTNAIQVGNSKKNDVHIHKETSNKASIYKKLIQNNTIIQGKRRSTPGIPSIEDWYRPHHLHHCHSRMKTIHLMSDPSPGKNQKTTALPRVFVVRIQGLCDIWIQQIHRCQWGSTYDRFAPWTWSTFALPFRKINVGLKRVHVSGPQFTSDVPTSPGLHTPAQRLMQHPRHTSKTSHSCTSSPVLRT